MPTNEFAVKLASAINQCSRENGSDTPDFILADFLRDVLVAWDRAVVAREKWYGRYVGSLDPDGGGYAAACINARAHTRSAKDQR